MYYCLAYYKFVKIEDPKALVEAHKAFFEKHDFRGRIYISEEGINGQASSSIESLESYKEWMHANPLFSDMPIKLHSSKEHIFEKMKVKYRKQLVGRNVDIDLSKKGHYLKPEEWKKTIESDEDYVLIDVRNDYEYQIGHFENALNPKCANFREFPQFLDDFKKTVDPNKKILMCCTGGIRCELFSAQMIQEGFTNVNQLEGGIIEYGNTQGQNHWLGKLFVFDDRLAVDISEEASEVIANCHFCNCKEDTFYNCANMDCNQLFIACPSCYHENKGCCQSVCQDTPRTRHVDNPLNDQKTQSNKPFRKWYKYFDQKQTTCAK